MIRSLLERYHTNYNWIRYFMLQKSKLEVHIASIHSSGLNTLH